jgi:hypothetical protein
MQLLKAPPWTYTAFLFLSEDVVLLANVLNHCLDLFRIPPLDAATELPSVLEHECTLQLPAISPDHHLDEIHCGCRPHPPRYSTPLPDTRACDGLPPFRNSGAAALCYFVLVIFLPDLRRHSCSLVARRGDLLALMPAVISCAEYGDISGTRPEPLIWSEWGPPITRWFDSDDIATEYVTSTCGQRWVQISAGARLNPSPIRILDFNPYHVRRLGLGYQMETSTSNIRVQSSRELLQSSGLFEEEVWSELPYVECVSKEQFDYDDVMVDEERIVGLRVRGFSVCEG